MNQPVYVTAGGARYHRTVDCRALEAMQFINEEMGGSDWVPGAPYAVCHATEPVTAEQAAEQGKTPCAVCKPPLAAATDDFGHEPVVNETEFFGETPDDKPVCARCCRTVREWGSYTTGYDDRAGVLWENRWVHYWVRVSWPCTSAVVLGLADRTGEVAA
ncbi:hypothetical protein ABZ154_15295 [Streptomyces sp. NPDC006261]|uniref:hypothetical protein n=1 Tax=Streptomyces sp. NPDC006261 TaxID=3156739 RepID=UPI0033AE9F82